MFKRIIYTSLNAHIFVICKDNLLKFSVIVHNSSVNTLILTFIARRSFLSDLDSFVFTITSECLW